LRATKNVFETDEARDLSDLMRAVSEPTRRDWVRAALGGRLINLDVRALNRLLDDDVAWTAEVEKFRAWHNVWQERGFASFMREFLASGNLTESILRARERRAGDDEPAPDDRAPLCHRALARARHARAPPPV
jgi:exodeoxyribonuclease V beta subunit